MDEVEREEMYELVITTSSGFFRYRFGDVIKVVDFYNSCPVVEFMYRWVRDAPLDIGGGTMEFLETKFCQRKIIICHSPPLKKIVTIHLWKGKKIATNRYEKKNLSTHSCK